LNAVRNYYPNANITWLVEEDAAPLVQGHEALDRVLVSKRKRWLRSLRSLFFLNTIKEVYGFIKTLRDTPYDLILDFQALLKSGILIALARGRRKIGFGKGLEHMEHSYIFLNERVSAVDMEIHALSRGMMLLNAVGISSNKIEYKLPVTGHDRNKIDELMKQHGINGVKSFIAINPVAKWETKLWPNEKFSELADMLIERYDMKIIFTGGMKDYSIIQAIRSKIKGRAINFAGKTTLTELAALYERATLVISTDTGPMHLAAAMGTPVVALFGPTAPWRTGPYGAGHQVIKAELECSPCFKRRCEKTDCMYQISMDQVLNGVQKVLGN
jgi:3-deoxy-D-manno-octulosonic-acid transferase/heptosyltransferase-1